MPDPLCLAYSPTLDHLKCVRHLAVGGSLFVEGPDAKVGAEITVRPRCPGSTDMSIDQAAELTDIERLVEPWVGYLVEELEFSGGEHPAAHEDERAREFGP